MEPPRSVEKVSEVPVEFRRVTKTLVPGPSPGWPRLLVWKAPGVTGKLRLPAVPATTTPPSLVNASAWITSSKGPKRAPEPPRNVDHISWLPSGLSRDTKLPVRAGMGGPDIEP